DPVACPDLGELDRVLADAEIVLHAATQDLPCLAELGFRPRRLFDTELAARLLGYERVGLATMAEVVLGLRLEKGHSAADCSGPPRRGGTGRAWPSSASGRAGCSTPGSPPGCWGTSGSGWPPWWRSSSACGWRRATPPRTGRGARSPRTGCATRRSTSRCWSS